MSPSRLFSFIVLALSFIQCFCKFQPKTLVVVDNDYSKYQYSRFFKSLKRRGHRLTIKASSDRSIKLLEFGESLFSNLILLSPSSSQIGDLKAKDVLSFIDHGNNVFIGSDGSYSSDFTKKIADRCGIELHPTTSNVVDHVNYDLLRSDDSLKNEVITIPMGGSAVSEALFGGVKDSEIPSSPILYSGIGLTVKKKAHLTQCLLSGDGASYSMDSATSSGPMEKSIVASGPSLSLVAALQTRSNGRVTVIGSLKALSDEYWISAVKPASDGTEHSKSGNEQFVSALSRWSFGERAILRVSKSEHHLTESEDGTVTLNPNRYRVKDSVHFEAKIEEFEAECDCWKAFVADDVEFELVRLDAFVRVAMKHDTKQPGRYWIDFVVPDTFGVYKLSIKYRRRGYSYLWTEELVSVRPFRHDEYDRFLPTAYPYYLGAASVVTGFTVFTAAFLFGIGSGDQKRIWR